MPDNKTIVRNYLEEVWTKHHHAAVDDYLSPDFAQHTSNVSSGRAGVRGFFAMLDSALSDLDFALEDVIAEGDKVYWRFTLRARHSGPFIGLAPTGKTITLTGMSIGRLAEGKLVEAWGEQDMLGLMQQLRS
jgi:predicted ester cyclase